MVSEGCAWAYTKYLENNSDLPSLESSAKSSALGLWKLSSPLAPWDYRHGTVPVTMTSSGNTIIPVTNETSATTWDRILDWAEHKYPLDLINGTSNQQTSDGIQYRCYSKIQSLFCAGVRENSVYTYDGTTISNIGNTSSFLDQATQDGF